MDEEEEEEKGREREGKKEKERTRGTLEVLIYFNHVLSKDSLSLFLFPIHFSMSEHKIVSRTNQVHLINYANQIL